MREEVSDECGSMKMVRLVLLAFFPSFKSIFSSIWPRAGKNIKKGTSWNPCVIRPFRAKIAETTRFQGKFAKLSTTCCETTSSTDLTHVQAGGSEEVVGGAEEPGG